MNEDGNRKHERTYNKRKKDVSFQMYRGKDQTESLGEWKKKRERKNKLRKILTRTRNNPHLLQNRVQYGDEDIESKRRKLKRMSS